MISKCCKCGVYRFCCLMKNSMCFECKRTDEKNNFEYKCKMKLDDINNLEKFLIKNPDKIYHYIAWCSVNTNVDLNFSY